MSPDPLFRLHAVFGNVLVHHRHERKWTADALANAAGLSEVALTGFEQADHGPTLEDFFRIAGVLGKQPPILLVDLISAWRADPRDTLHVSRSSDFQHLFRLGYDHTPGDFHKLTPCYYSVPEATHAARRLNAQRHTRSVALLDTVCIYVRLDSVSLRPDKGQHEGRQSGTH